MCAHIKAPVCSGSAGCRYCKGEVTKLGTVQSGEEIKGLKALIHKEEICLGTVRTPCRISESGALHEPVLLLVQVLSSVPVCH